jgi:two-component system chemotaxis sensor kinase CheA
VVVAAGTDRIGFAVDELIAEQEIVVKSLGPRRIPTELIAGATILADGGFALILNAARVIRAALAATNSKERLRPKQADAPPSKKKRVLIVEDSMTTRALEASILTAAGYEVSTAVDGVDAKRVLQDQEVDAIVADVEMPRMDGIALTESIRRSRRLKELPIVLVTGLANDADRLRGLEAGANAYIVKGTFDQSELLETLAQLL